MLKPSGLLQVPLGRRNKLLCMGDGDAWNGLWVCSHAYSDLQCFALLWPQKGHWAHRAKFLSEMLSASHVTDCLCPMPWAVPFLLLAAFPIKGRAFSVLPWSHKYILDSLLAFAHQAPDEARLF